MHSMWCRAEARRSAKPRSKPWADGCVKRLSNIYNIPISGRTIVLASGLGAASIANNFSLEAKCQVGRLTGPSLFTSCQWVVHTVIRASRQLLPTEALGDTKPAAFHTQFTPGLFAVVPPIEAACPSPATASSCKARATGGAHRPAHCDASIACASAAASWTSPCWLRALAVPSASMGCRLSPGPAAPADL